MSRQPQNQQELVNSVIETMGDGAFPVIPTIATRHADHLGGTMRTIANAMLLQARMANAGLTAVSLPTAQFDLSAQTDAFYRDQDQSGNFIRLMSIAQLAARGKR
jgi:hypothetical protein